MGIGLGSGHWGFAALGVVFEFVCVVWLCFFASGMWLAFYSLFPPLSFDVGFGVWGFGFLYQSWISPFGFWAEFYGWRLDLIKIRCRALSDV